MVFLSGGSQLFFQIIEWYSNNYSCLAVHQLCSSFNSLCDGWQLVQFAINSLRNAENFWLLCGSVCIEESLEVF